MAGITEDRALWIARNVLPHEPMVRAQISLWGIPTGLEPDDIIQEAYARFASMESVEIVRHPRNLFCTIARNVMVDHVRHAAVVSILSGDDFDRFNIADDTPSPETVASDRQQLHQLAIAVSKLPEPSRSALLMRLIDDMPHRDIGKKLGMSDNAVQKVIAKTLPLLLAHLMERFERGGNAEAGASNKSNRDKRNRNGKARDERRD